MTNSSLPNLNNQRCCLVLLSSFGLNDRNNSKNVLKKLLFLPQKPRPRWRSPTAHSRPQPSWAVIGHAHRFPMSARTVGRASHGATSCASMSFSTLARSCSTATCATRVSQLPPACYATACATVHHAPSPAPSAPRPSLSLPRSNATCSPTRKAQRGEARGAAKDEDVRLETPVCSPAPTARPASSWNHSYRCTGDWSSKGFNRTQGESLYFLPMIPKGKGCRVFNAL